MDSKIRNLWVLRVMPIKWAQAVYKGVLVGYDAYKLRPIQSEIGKNGGMIYHTYRKVKQ